MFWSQSSAPRASQVEVEERLHVYVDQKIDELRSELLALLDKKSGSPQDADKVAVKVTNEDKAEKDEPQKDEPPVFASMDHLDQHDEYQLGESVWDCAVFVGLDCIGPGESFVTLLLVLLNWFVQLVFCYIILFRGMVDEPLQSSELDGLLHFRASVAHDVGNANPLSGNSLLSQVCSNSARLHTSGEQVSLYADLDAFFGIGQFLCILALLCWCASALAEFNSTMRFTQAIAELKGKSTCIVVRGVRELEIESISTLAIVKVIVISVLPRVFTTVLLFYIGILYVSRTSRLEDLLLNAIALSFIMEVDELFFTAFIPHRVRSLVTGLAPLHLTPQMPIRRQWVQRCSRVLGGSPGVILRLLLTAGVLILIFLVELVPFHGRVQQAMQILCSGDQDFVYSINPASGMVNAARSAQANQSFTNAECAVLLLARPTLLDDWGWSPPNCGGMDLQSLSEFSVRDAPVLLQPGLLVKDGPGFFQSEFDYVKNLAKAGTEQASFDALCQDQVSTLHNGSTIYLAALQDAVGGDALNVASCEDVKSMCHWRNMTRLRALCPMTCECNLWGFTAAGFYKTAHYGCPKQCEVEAVVLEQRLLTSDLSAIDCLDFTNSRYFFPPFLDLGPAQLFAATDADEDGNLTTTEVALGFLRHTLDAQVWSDLFSFDFNSDGVWDPSEQSAMQLTYVTYEAFDKDLDGRLSVAEAAIINGSVFEDLDGDGFITVAEMAGHPQGLDVKVPVPPKRITVEPFLGANLFLDGVGEYILSRPNFNQSAQLKVELLSKYFGFTEEQKLSIVRDLVTGVTFWLWTHSQWLLGPGIPHPRGLVWCEFITSWETVLLLGVNICEPSDVASVRTMCPQSCSCEAGMKDCPSTCPNAHKLGSTGS